MPILNVISLPFRGLRALFPELSNATFKTLLSRTACSRYLDRLCRGLYICKRAAPPNRLVLFHAVALLRADEFNYISLETTLSEEGVISQIPTNWISIMSSGRSNVVSCGIFGTIEFIHTCQKPVRIREQLYYDEKCRLWRATIPLALRDMRATHRNCDLIDWDRTNKLI